MCTKPSELLICKLVNRKVCFFRGCNFAVCFVWLACYLLLLSMLCSSHAYCKCVFRKKNSRALGFLKCIACHLSMYLNACRHISNRTLFFASLFTFAIYFCLFFFRLQSRAELSNNVMMHAGACFEYKRSAKDTIGAY